MNNLQLRELQPLIIQWAKDKNLLFPENAPKQYLKLLEEVGETAHAILKNDVSKIKDGIGDIFVVLVILSEQIGFYFVNFKGLDAHKERCDEPINLHLNGIINSCFHAYHNKSYDGIDLCLAGLNEISEKLNIDLTECANIAWNEIKNRKGETINGTFIKE